MLPSPPPSPDSPVYEDPVIDPSLSVYSYPHPAVDYHEIGPNIFGP